jgi:hypothetical protein
MIRGAVYPVDLGEAKRGHEQRGRRLGLVISIEQNGRQVRVDPPVPVRVVRIPE